MEIVARSIGCAHKAVCKEILENGRELMSEDGEITWEYPELITIGVKNPQSDPQVSKFNNFQFPEDERQCKLDIYAEQLLNTCGNDFAYTYGNRLHDYPDVKMENGQVVKTGNRKGDGINQISWIIDKIIEEANTRRAVASTRDPRIDMLSDNPPCLTALQFMLRAGKLSMFGYFRSNDMLSAWGNNAYGLMHLLSYVCDEIEKRSNGEVKVEMGELWTTSISAHIYYKRDAEEVIKLRTWLCSKEC